MPMPAQDWSQNSKELSQLLARVGLGDREAFAKLYERSSARLFGVVLRIQRDQAAAEDILQEVFVKVWRSAAGFDAAQSQPLTWLTSVARNAAIDSLRRQQTQPQIQARHRADDDDDAPDAVDLAADEAPGPLELLSRATEARALNHCMQDLNAMQKQSLALAFYDGLSHAEVAEKMAQPLGTVKSWVRRALLSLKNCLEHAQLRDVDAGMSARQG
ncbi:sigma-70 family RNA polymerase sigma factor [Roseateles toxinivorans]|nr:sigma-70 family RNA polymerase sigma factor [Roseateles toxinivorans]